MKFFRKLFGSNPINPEIERKIELTKMFDEDMVATMEYKDNNCGIFINDIKVNPYDYDSTNKSLVDTIHNMKDLYIKEYSIWISHIDNKVKLTLRLKTINKEYNKRWATPDDINKEDNE